MESQAGRVWRWIVALCVLIEILHLTAAQMEEHMINVALNASCTQSSFHVHRSGPHPCSRSVNGNSRTIMEEPNCFHSGLTDPQPNMTVDLGRNAVIHRISLYGRTSYAIRFSSVQVRLDGKEIFTFPSNVSELIHHISIYKVGRTIGIQGPKKVPGGENPLLNICELQVFECQTAFWGQNCTYACSPQCKDLKEKDACDTMNGTCVKGCSFGHWRHNCTESCGVGCVNGTTCDMYNGSCQCRPHWEPPLCTNCVDGYWGENCQPCSETCQGSCNTTNGICLKGCVQGYWGHNCTFTCSQGCDGDTCNRMDGMCNCRHYWEGDMCYNKPCQCETFKCSKQRRYVYAKFSRKVNVAVGKAANSSSVLNNSIHTSAPACIAVNGKSVTGFEPMSRNPSNPACLLTAESDHYPWWQVDLGRPYVLAGINISLGRYRSDFAGMAVLVDDRQIFLYKTNTKKEGYIPVPFNTTAQVVKIKREFQSKNYYFLLGYSLYLCQVEVYVCRAGYYGPECEGICENPVCWNSQICSPVDGSCPPEETKEVLTVPVECSIMSVVAACIFDAVVVILCAVAAKTIPRGEQPKPKMIVTEAGKTETKDKGGDDIEIDDDDEEREHNEEEEEYDKGEDENDKEEGEAEKEEGEDNKVEGEDDKEEGEDNKEEGEDDKVEGENDKEKGEDNKEEGEDDKKKDDDEEVTIETT